MVANSGGRTELTLRCTSRARIGRTAYGCCVAPCSERVKPDYSYDGPFGALPYRAGETPLDPAIRDQPQNGGKHI